MVKENEFSRDANQIRHWGTGDLEINVLNAVDLEKAKTLIMQSYEGA